MDSPIVPLTLSDIFDRTFNLIVKTILRSLAIAFTFLILPVVLMSLAANRFYSSLADMTGGFQVTTPEQGIFTFIHFAGVMALFILATLIFALGVMFAEIGISIIVGKEIRSEKAGIREAIEDTFDKKWLYGIAQGLLKYMILIGGVVIIGITAAILVALAGRHSIGMVLLVILMVIVVVPVILFVMIRWYFSLTAVAVDGLGPVEALRKSWDLVRGHWWRTFGILILLSLVAQFAVSIISLPITFGSMFNVYKEFFTMLGKTKGEIDVQTLHNLQRSLGAGIGIGSGISSLLSLLITPVYTVVMYFDLRARHGEFAVTSPEQPTQEPPPAITK